MFKLVTQFCKVLIASQWCLANVINDTIGEFGESAISFGLKSFNIRSYQINSKIFVWSRDLRTETGRSITGLVYKFNVGGQPLANELLNV